MRDSLKRRLTVAIVFSVLAHVTAAIVLLPLLALKRCIEILLDEDNESLRICVFLAILLHIAIVLPLVHLIVSYSPEDNYPETLNIDLWDAEARSMLKEEEVKTPKEELEDYEPDEELEDGQVVDAPNPKDERPPDEKTRLLSEKDSKVVEETQSSIKMPGFASPAPAPSTPGMGKDTENLPGGMRIVERHTVGPLPSKFEPSDKGDRSAMDHAPTAMEDISTNPSLQAMASTLAGTGLDHLENIVDGDSTALNTLGFRYASFFNRIKREVQKRWHPSREYKLHDRYGNIYGFKDRTTVLLVVLRSDGSLKKAYIMEPSGAPFLDVEAREAVEKAEPFPNVPNGLKDKRDGLVKFTFHFVVKVGERPVFRMRRY
jgi:TonB family protein